MPNDDYDDDDNIDTGHDEDPPNWRRKLERTASEAKKRADAAEARAEKAERGLAFAKAGVPLDDPKASYFVKGYDGDLTPDAIKAAATEIGLVDAPAKDKDEIPQDEKDAHQRVADASAGSADGAGRDFHAEMRGAKSPAEVLRLAREAGVPMAEGTVVG